MSKKTTRIISIVVAGIMLLSVITGIAAMFFI